MRKNSIKALSLILSLLLVIPMLSVLPLSAGAEVETETLVGDLNGDGALTQDDIDILAAVLNGIQNADSSVNYDNLAAVLNGIQNVDGSVNYDISGNRMVDSDDLIVLKNLVYPSQPALPDKLADGSTDDLLSLVSTVEGGELQRAIVRGNSTKALELNATGNMTVLFAEPQDWSHKVTLEMDTLWENGGWTVTVTLLGADGETKLGTAGKAASQETGWSQISVPLTGVTAQERTEVGGFVISVAADAHVYLDNLYLTDAPEKNTTREEMEKALVEVAWNYYFKGTSVQYDSTEFNTRGYGGSNSPLSKDYGGAWRTNTFSTLEDATADFNLYSVCSDYCWNVYYEALGYPILGNRINAVTAGLFYNTQYPQDMAVLRWWDDGVDVKDKLTTYNNGKAPERTHTAEETVEFFTNYTENLRPGDIIVMHGNDGHQHAMLYVGNGNILHCGGGKFSMSTGKDRVEVNGAIQLATVKDTFLEGDIENEYAQGGFFRIKDRIVDTNKNGAWLVVVRPLDVLTLDDEDTDASNDELNADYVLDTGLIKYELANNDRRPVKTSGYGITDATASRLDYPGMSIERTVDVKNYGTVAQGGQLIYTIKITNNSNNTIAYSESKAYGSLKVTETIPANTSYVSNVGGGTYADGKITWTVNVAAGSSKTVSYTVTATGDVGDKIVNGGGHVANIPSNVLTTTIGGAELTNTKPDFVSADVSVWNSSTYKISANFSDGTSFADRVYNEWADLALDLPTVQELASNFFTQEKLYQPYGLHTNHDKSITRYMYTLNDRGEMAEEYRIYRDMLVEGYYGGVWVYSNDYNNEPRIIDPNVKYLEAGDILVCMNLKGSISGGTEMEDRNVKSWRVLVYLGDNTFASLNSEKEMLKVTGDAANAAAVSALTYDMFLLLRPSQAYKDVNDIGAFTGTVTWDDATDKTVESSEPGRVELTETAQNYIASLTESMAWENANLTFATEVYAAANMDIYTNGINGKSYANLLNNCFEKKTTGWLVRKTGLVLLEEYPEGYEGLAAMITHYGGTEFHTDYDVPLSSFEDLMIGDVVVMGNRDDGISAYLTAIYQGSNTFLIATREYPGVGSDGTNTQKNSHYKVTVTNLSNWLNQAINENAEGYEDVTYKGYVVLRPSLAYDDLSSNAVRDIRTEILTDDEKRILADLDADDWLEGGRALSLSGFSGWAYRSAGVSLSSVLQNFTVNDVKNARFNERIGQLYHNAPTDANYDAYYAAMILPGCYGGSQLGKNAGRTVTAGELEIGDIFAAARKDPDASGEYIYRVALYQDEGQFLIVQWNYRSEGKAWTSTTEIIGEDYSDWLYYFILRPDGVHTPFLVECANADLGETKDLSQVLVTVPGHETPVDLTWESSNENVVKIENEQIVMVGKGECTITATSEAKNHSASGTVRVTRNITSGALTEEEITSIENFSTDEPAWWYGFANTAYEDAGIMVDVFERKLSFNNLRSSVFSSTESDYTKMLIPGCYGGSKNTTNKTFVPEDLKVGDFINAVYISACEHSTEDGSKHWQYVAGMYIGDGKFLVSHLSNGCEHEGCSKIYVDEYGKELANGHTSFWSDAESLNSSFQYYFILRPERLAPDALQSISLNKTELDLYRKSQETLTVTTDTETVVDAAKVTWRSDKEAVATVDANGQITGVSEGTAVITAYYEGYSASCTVTVDSNRLITSGALTAEEMAAISDLTSLTTVGKNPGYVADEVYTAAGIDISTLLSNQSFNAIYGYLENTTVPDYAKMLMADYTGGSDLEVYPTFVPNDLKVGDLIMAYANVHCAGCNDVNTLTGVYIGDGQFLVAPKNIRTAEACATSGGCYVDAYADVASNEYSLWGEKTNFTKYFILRPERLAPDALQSISLNNSSLPLNYFRSEDLVLTGVLGDETEVTLDASRATWTSSNTAVATVDDNGKVTGVAEGSATITVYYEGYSATCAVTVSKRNITSGPLTAEEMVAIQGYDRTLSTAPLWHMFAKEFYSAAGIDVTVFNDTTVNQNGLQAKVITTDGLVKDETDYTKMLVPDYYGGSSYQTEKTFVPEDFKVGDIMVAISKSTTCEHGTGKGWKYYTGIYQGDGKFLVSCNAGSCDDCKGTYEDICVGELASCYTSFWSTDVTDLNNAYKFYFVLRPERLASDAIQSISLNTDTLDLYRKSQETLTVTTDTETVVDAAKVTWRSDDEAVATVDANGQITGVSAGTAVITAYYEGYSASCTVTVDSKRLITSGALTPEEMAAIQGYNRTLTNTPLWHTFAKEFYSAAGIDVTVFNDTTVNQNGLQAKVITTDGLVKDETDYTKMLVPDYYGGNLYQTEKTFVPADFKIGDIMIAISKSTACEHGTGKGWKYITGIYQGDGKFLVSCNATSCADCKGIYEDICGGELASCYTSFWSTDVTDLNNAYKFYFVLRPERLASDALQSISLNETELTLDFSDANSLPAANAATLTFTKDPTSAVDPVNVVWTTSNPDVATVVDGKVTAVGAGTCTITVNCDGYKAACEVTISRSIEARTTLTQTEKTAISALTQEDLSALTNLNPGPVAYNVYLAAGIDISAVLQKEGFNDVRKAVLANTETDYTKILLPGYYGGYSKSTGKTFVPADMKVGDIFCATYGSATCEHSKYQYLTGIYQGDGKFLVVHFANGCTDGCSIVYVDEYGKDLTNGKTSIWSDTAAEMETFQYYFVLRPERLGHREITEGALTQEEMNSIAGYTTATPGTLAQFAENAYAQAGINLDPVTGDYSVSGAREALLDDDTGALIEGDTVWHKMLVAGSNGGSANAESTKTFAQADFQVGDLFCAIGKCEHEYWVATTAVYQGNGKFLVSSFKADCACHGVYVDDITDVGEDGFLTNGRVSIWANNMVDVNGEETLILKAVWKHYFVLRPSQLAE